MDIIFAWREISCEMGVSKFGLAEPRVSNTLGFRLKGMNELGQSWAQFRPVLPQAQLKSQTQEYIMFYFM